MTAPIRTVPRVLSAVLATFAATSAGEAARADTPSHSNYCSSATDCYNKIKSQEGKLPQVPQKEIVLGDFTPSTGKFESLPLPKPTDYGPQHLGWNDTVGPALLDAVNVKFRVTLLPAPPDTLQLSLDGKPPPPPPPWAGRGEDVRFECNGHVTIVKKTDRGDAICTVGPDRSFIDWKITAGNHTKSGTWTFARNKFITGGAFTIPAVPMTILYEPPPNKAGTNRATLTKTTSTSTNVTFNWEGDRGVTRPGQLGDSNAASSSQMGSLLTSVAPLANAIPVYGQAISAVLQFLGSGMGHASASDTKVNSVQNQKGFEFSHAATEVSSTGSNLGPGLGDKIIYLRNVKVVWVGSSVGAELAVLDPGSYEGFPVKLMLDDIEQLKSQPNGKGKNTLLDRRTLEGLVRLDPFIDRHTLKPNPDADLDAHRFAAAPSVTVSGAGYEYSTDHTVEVTDQHAATSYSTDTQDYSAGFLSFLGIGPGETKTLTTTTTNSSGTTKAVGQEVAAALDLYADATELYTVEVFYDRVFGTFAFKRDNSTEDRVVGTVANMTPGARVLVTLHDAHGRKFMTYADKNGKFVFRSRHLDTGDVKIQVGSRPAVPAKLLRGKAVQIVVK